MKSTWFHYLPWVGNPIKYQAEHIARDERRVKELQAEIRELRQAIKRDSASLEKVVLKDWTPEEVAEAKAAYQERSSQPADTVQR